MTSHDLIALTNHDITNASIIMCLMPELYAQSSFYFFLIIFCQTLSWEYDFVMD